jgi:hypothetical protein
LTKAQPHKAEKGPATGGRDRRLAIRYLGAARFTLNESKTKSRRSPAGFDFL